LGVNISAAANEDLALASFSRQVGVFDGMGDVAAFGLVISIARHDDHSAAGKRPAN